MTIFRKIKYPGTLNNRDFYNVYLHVLNSFLPIKLTETEIDILVYVYHSGKILTTDTRRRLQEILKISDKNLNNFVSKLKKKEAIINNQINQRLYLPKGAPSQEQEDNYLIQLDFVVNNAPRSTTEGH